MKSKSNKKPDPSDKKFESGIYNYCDRWCERCEDKAKCYLHSKKDDEKKHLKWEEAPEDYDVIMQDMLNSFKETYDLLKTQMQKMGISKKDLKEMPEAEDDPDFNEHPLMKKSHKYLELTHKFLNEFTFEQQKMVMQFGIEIPADDVLEEIKTILWYHSFLPVKCWRLLYDLSQADKEPDKELKQMQLKDLKKLYHLLYKCISQSAAAVKSFAEKRKETAHAPKMTALLSDIKKEVDKIKKCNML